MGGAALHRQDPVPPGGQGHWCWVLSPRRAPASHPAQPLPSCSVRWKGAFNSLSTHTILSLCSSFCSFIKHVLSTDCVPGPVLRWRRQKQIIWWLSLWGAEVSQEETKNHRLPSSRHGAPCSRLKGSTSTWRFGRMSQNMFIWVIWMTIICPVAATWRKASLSIWQLGPNTSSFHAVFNENFC